MFKKPFTAKPQTTLKNSDRKKLRNKLQEQYKLSDDDAKLLLPDVVSVMRIKTYIGENAVCLEPSPILKHHSLLLQAYIQRYQQRSTMDSDWEGRRRVHTEW